MRTFSSLAAIVCAIPAFGAVVTCGIYVSPIECQKRADQAAANEKAYREAVQKKAEMNQEIAAARAKFWATYPINPGSTQLSYREEVRTAATNSR